MATRRMNRNRTAWTTLTLLLAAGLALPALAQEKVQPKEEKSEKGGLIQKPDQKEEKKAPPTLPPGTISKAAAGVGQPGAGQPGAMEPSPLHFEAVEHDWGVVSDLEKVTHAYKFKNTSDTKLKITAAASCGCTVAALTKDTFEAGEEGEITATFDPHGRPGAQTKTVTVTIIDPPGKYQQTVLTARCNVKAMVVVEPNKVFANEVDHRIGNTQKLKITGRKEGFKVTSIETNNPMTKATLGESRQVTVDGDVVTEQDVDLQILPGAAIGTLQAQLTIQTNDDRVTVPPLFFGGDVVGDVRATPPSAFFHQVFPATAFNTQVRLDNKAGTAFKITEVDIEGGVGSQMVTSITPMGEGEGMYYIVKVSGVGPSDSAIVSGALVIKTDHEGETIRVPFNGAVRMRGTANGGVPQQPSPLPGAQPIKGVPTSATPVITGVPTKGAPEKK